MHLARTYGPDAFSLRVSLSFCLSPSHSLSLSLSLSPSLSSFEWSTLHFERNDFFRVTESLIEACRYMTHLEQEVSDTFPNKQTLFSSDCIPLLLEKKRWRLETFFAIFSKKKNYMIPSQICSIVCSFVSSFVRPSLEAQIPSWRIKSKPRGTGTSFEPWQLQN